MTLKLLATILPASFIYNNSTEEKTITELSTVTSTSL